MIYFKTGIYAAQLRWPIVDAINAAHDIYQSLGHDLIITSLHDGKNSHRPDSYHFKDLAVDIRTHILTTGQKKEVKRRLENMLGIRYDVILHDTHIHIEYDYEVPVTEL